MENKKKLTIGLIIGLITLLSGISYAYFTATFQNLGVRETSILTETLGNLKLTGETVFTSENLYPGEMGVQEFSIEPVSQGKGIYELDLNAVVPSEFGGDIFITLYRATSNEASVSVTEGELTQEGDNYYKQDTLSTSNVEIIYPASSLTNNSQIVLFQTEFDETLTNTKYYLVYDYRNRGNQNNQMGKSFSATISGRLVKELNGAGVIAKLAGSASRNSTALIDNGEVLDGEEVLCTNTLAYDDFGNLRYVGDNPCNYVTFNDETPEMYDEYQYYIDGPLHYSGTLDMCEQMLPIFEQSYQNLIEFESTQCTLNEETSEYHVYIKGFYKSGSYVSEEECSNDISSSGLSEKYPGRCTTTGKKVSGNGWRIIGVIDNQLKIIRNESIGHYSWDTSAPAMNNGYGINQWGESGDYKGADIMKLLNPGYEDNTDSIYSCEYDSAQNKRVCTMINEATPINNSLYWNRSSGKCFDLAYNGYSDCDFSSSGLTENAKNMIDYHTWHLGSQGNNDINDAENKLGLAKKFYEYERSNNTGKICESTAVIHEAIGDFYQCTDNVNRTTIWEGYIGLMSPSDYGYAVGGEVRENCINNTNLTDYLNNNCNEHDWLYKDKSPYYRWTMMPKADSSSATDAFRIDSVYNPGFSESRIDDDGGIKPALYLKSNVSITGGEGTPTNPYVLSLN